MQPFQTSDPLHYIVWIPSSRATQHETLGARLTRGSQLASTDCNMENEGQFGSFFREEAVMVFAHAKAFVCIYCVRHQLLSLICVLGNVNILPVRVCVACQRVCVHTLVNLWSAETCSARQTLTAVIRGLHAVMLLKACRPRTHRERAKKRGGWVLGGHYREGSLGVVRCKTRKLRKNK